MAPPLSDYPLTELAGRPGKTRHARSGGLTAEPFAVAWALLQASEPESV
jgi:hypothetical protein